VAAIRATLLCNAGARQIAGIARALLSNGRPPEESAVLVYDATTPRQQTIQGTVGDIADQALPDRPALLIVGPVAGLREHLRWFDTRPLFGRRIVVTRSRDQAAELVDRLELLGAETISMPTIRILPPDDLTLMDAACDTAERFDWIVFTSANGVEHFMARFLSRRDIRDLKGVSLCTIGPATTAAVEKFGLRVALTPGEYRGEAVVAAFSAVENIRGKRFLLPRAQIARELLGDELRKAGAEVVELTAYRTLAAADTGGPDVYRMLLDRRIDAVTFTSASTVRNFVNMLGSEQAVDLLRTTTVATIGPVTAEAAQQLGITTTVMPDRYTVPALVEALVDHFRKHPEPAEVSS
jgi:uroporphyrinogen III methyltransferase/synthase